MEVNHFAKAHHLPEIDWSDKLWLGMQSMAKHCLTPMKLGTGRDVISREEFYKIQLSLVSEGFYQKNC
jgi:hypothetical protein